MPIVNNSDRKTVCFAPLNWGLGHATRIIPLVKSYQSKGWKVLIASDGIALQWLKNEYPDIETYDINSKPLAYSRKKFLIAHLGTLVPNFLSNIKKDRLFVEQLVKHQKIDLIVSDNRYGFRHPKVNCVFLTHQLQLAFPSYLKPLKKIVQNKINHWINLFNFCWIIDNEQHSFAGKLSSEKALKIPFKFIGLLSRLESIKSTQSIDVLAIVSGLEPQRSIFENQIINALKNTTYKVVIIGGQNGKPIKNTKFEYISFANSKTLNTLINKSKCVISRSGYSSIMDLVQLDKKAILVATPGQVEQQYLAEWHHNNPNFTISKDTPDDIRIAVKALIKEEV